MADLSLKQLDDGLMKAVKLAAFTAGKSLRDFVIGVLTEAVNGTRDRVEGDVVGVPGSLAGTEGKSRKSGQRLPREDGDPGGSRPLVAAQDRGDQPGARRAKRVILDNPITQQFFKHDVSGCKVYRCGMCSSLGVKDSQRGLK